MITFFVHFYFQLFVHFYIDFNSRDQVAKHYNISSATIWNWISKDRKQGTLENDIYRKRGRTKESNLTKEDWKERYEILKKYQAFLKAQREKK